MAPTEAVSRNDLNDQERLSVRYTSEREKRKLNLTTRSRQTKLTKPTQSDGYITG